MRKKLYQFYWRLQRFITSELKYSQEIYEEVLYDNCDDSIKWLDLGCGHQVLPSWRLEKEKTLVNKVSTVVGIDYDYLSLTKHKTISNRLRGDIANLPFPENTFDLITSCMVFEHLDDPILQLKEISRVLSIGGKLIFHTPNKIGYSTLFAMLIPEKFKDKLIKLFQGREEEDVFPAYYLINSPSRIREIAAASGFKVLKIRMICSSAQFIILPPIVVFELIWIKFLLSRFGKALRTNIIAIMEKA